MARPKVVFDTNVFLRALINPKGINARLVQSLDQVVLVVSPAIVEEVADVLSRTELLGVKGVRKLDGDRLVELLRQAPVVFPGKKVTVCRDPDDDKFLEAALAAKAEYLVTGDSGPSTSRATRVSPSQSAVVGTTVPAWESATAGWWSTSRS